MRICKKCGEVIPVRTKINGASKSLFNRKFCLICSPYGKHNTKKDDPSRIVTNKSLPYSQWPDSYKKSLIASNYRRGQERKNELIELLGGKCKKCGYNKNSAVLGFHHIDKETRLFSLSLPGLSQHSWCDVLKESIKCELLCQNCHGELHYPNLNRKVNVPVAE